MQVRLGAVRWKESGASVSSISGVAESWRSMLRFSQMYFLALRTPRVPSTSIKHERRQTSAAHISKTLDFKPKQCRRINSTSERENMEILLPL